MRNNAQHATTLKAVSKFLHILETGNAAMSEPHRGTRQDVSEREKAFTAGLQANVCQWISVEPSTVQLSWSNQRHSRQKLRRSILLFNSHSHDKKAAVFHRRRSIKDNFTMLRTPLSCICHPSINSVASPKYFISLLSRSGTKKVRE